MTILEKNFSNKCRSEADIKMEPRGQPLGWSVFMAEF